MIIYCNEFVFQLYSVQYKIIFLSVNAALEIVSEKLLYMVLFRFLKEMQMSGKYLSSIMLICVHGVSIITLLMFSLKCFFFWDPQETFIHFELFMKFVLR